MANVTTTTAANALAQAWAQPIEGYFEEALDLFSILPRYDSLAVAGAKTIDVPIIGAKSAQTKTSGTDLTAAAITETKAQITFTHYAVYEIIERVVEAQTNFSVGDAYMRGQAAALRAKLNAVAAVVIKTAAAANDVPLTTDDTLTQALFNTGMSKLHENKVTTNDGRCHCVCSPAFFASLSALSAFSDASVRGGGASYAVNGEMGTLNGVRIHVASDWSSGGTADTATLFHESALVAAINGGLGLTMVPSAKAIGLELTTDVLAGITMAVDTRAVNFVNPA